MAYSLSLINMNPGNKDSKQPKVVRHEQGKQKCRIYQRSLSSKQKTHSQSQTQVPLPGQFAIQKSDFRLTSNIRLIMKQSHPQTASHFLSNNMSRKNISHSSSNLHKNPHDKKYSNQTIIESRRKIELPQLKEVQTKPARQEQKKTSYLVKPKVQIAKFASGYRGIKIQEPKKRLKIQSSEKEAQKEVKQQKIEIQEANFLPLQYYLLDQYKPEELMKIYKVGDSQYVLGFSRWYDLEGRSNWKKCRVVGFDYNTARWTIEWLHNGKSKQVSRANLYFQGESKQEFQSRLKVAQQFRKNSEVYLKYNIDVDQSESTSVKIPEKTLENILRRVGHPKSQKYSNQVVELFNRANKQAQFNALLPFNEQKKKLYQSFLPPYLFQPNQQHLIRQKKKNTPVLSVNSIKYFESASKLFKEKTSLSQLNRLSIINDITKLENQGSNLKLFYENSEKIITVQSFVRNTQINMNEFARVMQRGCCDIQHEIGKELDKLYIEKKEKPQEFQKKITQYNGFISMVIIRLQGFVRQFLTQSYIKVRDIFTVKEKKNKPEDLNHRLKIQLHFNVKELKIECTPPLKQINRDILNLLQQITQRFSQITCPSKSYLCSIRPNNLLSIEHQPYSLETFRDDIKERLYACTSNLQSCILYCSNILQEMLNLPIEVKNKMQKKLNYLQIEMVVLRVNQVEQKLKRMYKMFYIEEQNSFNVECFYIKCQEALSRAKKKLFQGKRQLYKAIFDKIIKQNDKLEKSINFIEQKLQMHPQNINQMLQLENVIKQLANQQLEKVQSRIKQLPQKIRLLELIQEIQYQDYQLLHKIYISPFRLRQKLKDVKKDIENTYRKKFWDEITRQAGRILQATRECGQEMLNCLKIQSLDQMCERFSHYRLLHQKIEFNLKEATVVNQRQEAMNWSLTDFGKLNVIQNDFKPYFSLVTLAKNYQVHLELLANGPFSTIDPSKLQKELEEASLQLQNIKQLFKGSTRMFRISLQVSQLYSTFKKHLPFIKALRNPDLRERHWFSIRESIAINPLDPEVSLKALLNEGAQIKLVQLQQISAIATRELVYQRRLIRLKKEWKEVKFHFNQQQVPKIVMNLKQLCSRVEMDIFQIQQMLGANFIKFLEAQIICWRNQILYKAFQFLQKWQKLQNQVQLLANIFNKPRACAQMPRQHFQSQLLQKAWKNLCNQIQSQPSLNDILQSKTLETLSSLQVSSERIRKQLYAIFQQKKRQYARLACISDDLFVNLLSCDESDPGENPVFQQTVRKCFQNIKALIRNDQKQIVRICISSGQEIKLKKNSKSQKPAQFVLPNEVIVQLQKEIHSELKSSLENIKQQPERQITQILLLYQRINFVLRVEQQIQNHEVITPNLIRELQMYRDQLLQALPKNLSPKSYSELLQALYHLQLATSLWQNQYLDIFSFHWISQPRIYIQKDQYQVRIGLFSEPYGFQITDLDGIVIDQWSARVFCSMAAIIRDRGLCLIAGQASSGKFSSICKLAAIFGRKEQTLDCGSLVSPRNLLQLIRMAASGIWVILKNLQSLPSPQTSILLRNLQIIWTSFLLHPNEDFKIQNTQAAFKTKNLKIFATKTLSDATIESTTNIRSMKQMFRCLYLSRINLQFIIGAKLLLLRLTEVNSVKLLNIIHYIYDRMDQKFHSKKTHSKLSILIKFFQKIQQVMNLKAQLSVEEVVGKSLFIFLKGIFKEQALFEIICNLNQLFEIKIQFQNFEYENFKDQFLNQRYFYNQNLLNVYANLVQSITNKKLIIILGANDTGKSTLVKLLKISEKVQLHELCPNAYSLAQLYGDNQRNGIICSIIQRIQKNIKKQVRPFPPQGILFNGQFGEWTEPLTKIDITGHISQPNGNTLLINQDIKLIFETYTLQKAAPNVLLHGTIFALNQPLKWQNVFNWYINTQFNQTFRQPFFLKFIQLFIPYIVDPLFEFYQNLTAQCKYLQQNTFVQPIPLILSLLKVYQALLHYHFLDQSITQLSQKVCSDSFNIFAIALIWTFGASLPQEGKKSFQRHFKYLIKRAVQVQISGVFKQSLPGDDQDLFANFYYKGKWQQWSNCQNYVKTSTGILQRPTDIGLSFIIERNLQRGEGVLLCGPNNGHKTLFMEEFQKNINKEAFNILKILFVPHSGSNQIKGQLLKQIKRSKYSFNFQGFPHGKKTVFIIRDLSLPLESSNLSRGLSHYQFIRHYYVTKGWYLTDSDQHYYFKNIIFCGTLNYELSYPKHLSKYFLTINRALSREDLNSIVKQKVKNALQRLPNLTQMILDLHFTISQEFESLAIIPFSISQVMTIVNGFAKFGKASRHELLRFWIFMSEKVYEERLRSIHKQKLFYLLNNVLIQKEKIRYKSIKPHPQSFGVYFLTSSYNHYNIKSLKKEVQYELKSFFIKQTQKSIQSDFEIRRQQSLQAENLVKLKTQQRLKQPELKLLATIISTLDFQAPYILTTSHFQPIQRCLLNLNSAINITSILRKSRLIVAKTKLNKIEAWRKLLIDIVETILLSIQKNRQIKEVLVYFPNYQSQNSFIIDDLIFMKRKREVQFCDQLNRVIQNFVQNRDKMRMQLRVGQNNEHQNEFFGFQSKGKTRERKFQFFRREKERRQKEITNLIVDKIKVILHLNIQTAQVAKYQWFIGNYKDVLRDFSFINLDQFCKEKAHIKQLKFQTCKEIIIGENPIITQFQDNQNDNQPLSQWSLKDKSLDFQDIMSQAQDLFIDRALQKISNKFALIQEKKWQRGKGNNFKQLYQGIKKRLQKIADQKLKEIHNNLQTIMVLNQIRKILSQNIKFYQKAMSQMASQFDKIQKQKVKREFQYQRCVMQNQNIEKNLVDLEKERVELQITYQRAIEKQFQQFYIQKQKITQILKIGKDHKIIAINSEMKTLLQTLGFIYQKKIKKQEEMYRQVIRDINSTLGNTKITKKISNLLLNYHFNLSEKLISKLRDNLKEIVLVEKIEKKPNNEEKEENFTEKLMKKLKIFYLKLFQCFDRLQQKQAKEIAKRLSDNQKLFERMRENLSKNLKSPEYKAILQNYQHVKDTIQNIQSNRIVIKNLKQQNQEVWHIFNKIQSVECPVENKCGICNEKSCKFICVVHKNLLQEQKCINQLIEESCSLAFTLSIIFYFQFETNRKAIEELFASISQNYKINLNQKQIFYNSEGLPKLSLLSCLLKLNKQDISSLDELDKVSESTSKVGQVVKQFESSSFLALMQFFSGLLVLGLQSQNFEKNLVLTEKDDTNMLKKINQLYSQYRCTASQLISALKNRNQSLKQKNQFITSHQERISVHSIAKQTNQAIQMFVVVLPNKQEYLNCLSILQSQQIPHSYNIILVTAKENISNEQKIYCYKQDNTKSEWLYKKIDLLLSNFIEKSQKGDTGQDQNENIIKIKKQHFFSAMQYLLILSQSLNLTQTRAALQEKHFSAIQEKLVPKTLLQPTKVEMLKKWIGRFVQQLQKGFQIFTSQGNFLRNSSQRLKNLVIFQNMSKKIWNLYQVLIHLQSKGWISRALTDIKFWLIMKNLCQKEDQLSKKTQTKPLSELKLVIWNNIAVLYPKKHLLLFFIFHLVFESDLDSFEAQSIPLAINFCLQSLKKNLFFEETMRKVNKKFELITLYFKISQQSSSTSIFQNEQQAIKLNSNLIKYFNRFQSFLREKDLVSSLQHNKKEWYIYFKNINNQTINIPPNLLQTNKLTLFFFLCVFNPKKVQKWLLGLENVEYYLNNQSSFLHSQYQNKNLSLSINQISFVADWVRLSDRLNYHYNYLQNKQIYLINYHVQQLVQICQQQKINFKVLDFSTLLLKIDQSFESNPSKQPLASQNSSVALQPNKIQEEIIDQLKNYIRNETWIIINMDYHRVTSLNLNKFYKRIYQLFEAITRPQNLVLKQRSSESFNEYTVLSLISILSSKITKSVDITKYKYLLIFTTNEEQAIANQFRNPKKDDYEMEQSELDYEQWLSIIHRTQKSINQQRKIQTSQLALELQNLQNFKINYYKNVLKRKKNNKQYQKLQYLEKKAIYQFLTIADEIFKDMKGLSANKNIKLDEIFLRQVMSRVNGCVTIIKKDLLTTLALYENDKLGIFKGITYITKQQIQKDYKKETIVHRIQQFITMLVEYSFELNYKTNLYLKRVRSTHENVSQIKKQIQHLNSYQIENIVSHSKIHESNENSQERKLVHLEICLDANILINKIQPQEQKLNEEGKKPNKQEQKLIEIYLNEFRVNSFSTISKQIQSLFQIQIAQKKQMVQVLKLLNLKAVFQKYQERLIQVQQVLSVKHGRRIKKYLPQPKDQLAFLVFNAITTIVQGVQSNHTKETQKIELKRLEEITISVLLRLYDKISSHLAYISFFRQLVKEFTDLDYKSLDTLVFIQKEAESQDEEENQRRREEKTIKKLITNKVNLKALIEKQNRILSETYQKIFGHKAKRNETFNEHNVFQMVEILVQVKQRQTFIQGEVNQAIHNYKKLEEQSKYESLKIENSIYSEFQSQVYCYRLSLYNIQEIIELNKLIHAKKHHRQVHQLITSFTLVKTQGKAQNGRTTIYFRGFSLYNAKYKEDKHQIIVFPEKGLVSSCSDLYLQVRIDDEIQLELQEEDSRQINYAWYKCPFYYSSSSKPFQIREEVRERVRIRIQQFDQSQVTKANVYIIN